MRGTMRSFRRDFSRRRFLLCKTSGHIRLFAPQAQSPRAFNPGIIAPRGRICILTHDAEARRM
jgi:hypothetical protein